MLWESNTLNECELTKKLWNNDIQKKASDINYEIRRKILNRKTLTVVVT